MRAMAPHRLLFGAALAIGTALARAQDGDDAEVPRWPAAHLPRHLAAGAPRAVAWAAFLVQRDRVRPAIPAVRAALARLADDQSIESEFARLQLLDALVQLDVRLPGEELLPHAASDLLRVPALILAARSPEANASYFAARMEALGRVTDLEWRVCGNLLAAQHDPHFVAQCVRQFQFTIYVTVRDDGPRGTVIRNGHFRVRPSVEEPSGFPPVPRYHLDSANASATGADLGAVPFRRELVRGCDRPAGVFELGGELCELDVRADPHAAQVAWLTANGGAATQAACSRERALSVRWQDEADLRRSATAAQEVLAQDFAAMVDELRQNGRLLQGDAEAAKPNVRIALSDERRDRTQRLPEVETLLLAAPK
jgi:hypothetical protein